VAASASDAHPFPIYNARFRYIAPLLDADGDLVTGATTPDSELSQDCGTFADATNEMTEIATSSGMYFLDLIATEMDTKSTAILMKSATAGMKTTPVVLYPVRLPVIRTGTAQAGAASTITLDSGASAIDDYYVGCYVNITNDSPANARGQARMITDYVGSTKVATVEGTYGTNPSSASTFEVLATAFWIQRLADVNAYNGIAATSLSGRPEVNTTHAAGTAWNSGAIGASTLAADTITDAKVASDVTIASVTGAVGSVASGGITTASFAAGAIDAAAIADGAIDAATFAANAITATVIAADAITDAKVASDVTIASVTGAVGSVTGAVGSVTGSVGSVASGGITAASFAANAINAAKLDPDVTTELQAGLATAAALTTVDTVVNAILAMLDDARTEPGQGAPPVNPDLATKIDYLYKAFRNRKTQTATTLSLYADDGTTVDQKATISDDATTYVHGEIASGP
jgi:hypothetical protein